MNKIQIMPIDLSNKIAAGEVIENQASVVKELVENSIDANASKIEIMLLDSGFQLIQIVDNGEGMSKDDLLLCFKPHATSKLKLQYDLFNIETLGFRGEALASIASIAKVKIASNDGNTSGYILDVNEDKLSEGYQNNGTKISVYNLFYNVPARLKYLQSQKSELANIIDIVSRFALTYPNSAFLLTNDNKTLVNTSGNGNLLQVINGVYSLDITQNMEELSFENDDFKVVGYIGNNKATRSNKRGINVFINNRLVFNKELENAIIRGYGEYLMEKRYPVVVLNIKCDYQLIDVNVHPAKLEVRISKLNELLNLLEESIRDKFNLIKKEFITKPKFIQPSMEFTYVKRDNKNDEINYPNSNKPSKINETISSFEIEEPNIFKTRNKKEETDIEIDFEKSSDFVEEKVISTPKIVDIEPEILIQFNVIGQFDATYILAQSEKGLHLIDQHAAMERINYEKILNKVNAETFDYQDLTVPLIIPLTLSEKVKVLVLSKVLKEIGIKVEEQANNDLIVRQIPLWVDLENANAYIQQTIDYVLELNNVKITDIKKENLIMASCKMSLKANQVLTLDEQQTLVDNLLKTNNYDHCPHGRPIIVTFSKTEVEKMFKRII
ncbi:DNA mismatch repair protein MutL [Bacilli bacterium PM5-3]|nr:DNA mismatch repair protein MutL [Bacilli bacterium PM5-3]MDH6603879.1 DNA mismatch repair protein MutL [Bacilli bacterium PM5-9]